jgi:putative oxidoreductase
MRNLRTLPDYGTSLYRIVVGFLMACHGASSLFAFPVKSAGGHTVSPTVWPGGVAAVLQLTFGVLVLVGLRTRTSAVLLSGTMAYAYFSVHQEKALLPMANGGEPAALFSWAFLSIALLGAGPLSLDAVLARARRGAGTGRSDTERAAAIA